MSEFETTGLSITLFKPTITVTEVAVGPNTCVWVPEGAYLSSFAQEVTDYQHSLQALGGYSDASFSLVLNKVDLEWWIQEGLGVHVVTKNPAGVTVWEGFVNELAINLGHFSMNLGPLTSTGNQVTAIYTMEDTTTTPPTTGVRMRTSVRNYLLAQQRYGIFPKVITVGGATTVESGYIRSQWLWERAWPDTTKKVGMGQGEGNVLLTFKCSGYYAMLNYPYNNLVPPVGTVALSTKIGSILTAAPNALFSTANASIAACALPVPVYEGDDQLGWSIIKDLVVQGDGGFVRYICGVYAGRNIVYIPTSEEIFYFSRLTDTLQQVTDLAGSPIAPWDVLPGKWLLFPDLLPGMDTPTGSGAFWSDPRAMFIEEISYTAPYSIQLTGGKSDHLTQRLAQLGLGGA